MTNDLEKYPMTYVTTLVTMDSEGTEYDGNYIRAQTIQNPIQKCYLTQEMCKLVMTSSLWRVQEL